MIVTVAGTGFPSFGDLTLLTLAAGIVHIPIGAFFVYGLYAVIERVPTYDGLAGGIYSLIFVFAVLSMITIFSDLWEPMTWGEFITAVWMAVIGAGIGSAFVGWGFEPAIDSKSSAKTEEI